MQKQMHRHRKLKENIILSLSCSSSATPTLGNGLLPFRAILDVTCSNVRRKQLKCDGAAFFLIKQSLRHNRMAPASPGHCRSASSEGDAGPTPPAEQKVSQAPLEICYQVAQIFHRLCVLPAAILAFCLVSLC